MEEIKKSRGKIGTNAYRTNMSTLKRISNYDFANIPIEKVKRESIEDFLEDERNKSNSIIKKDYGMLSRIYDYAEENDYIKKNFFRGFNKIEKTQSKIATKQVNPMTFDEEKRFKEYLINNSHPFRNLVLIEVFLQLTYRILLFSFYCNITATPFFSEEFCNNDRFCVHALFVL